MASDSFSSETVSWIEKYLADIKLVEDGEKALKFPRSVEKGGFKETYVRYEDFDPLRLVVNPPDSVNKNGVSYKEAKIQYNYPVLDPDGNPSSRLDTFRLEGPELTSNSGIHTGPNRFTKIKEKVMRMELDDTSAEVRKFMTVLDEIYWALCASVYENFRGFFGKGPNPKIAPNGFRPFYSYSKDGNRPAIYSKLIFYQEKTVIDDKTGKSTLMPEKVGTIFNGIDQVRIKNPDVLENAQVKLFPLWTFPRIFMSSARSFQMKFTSALVTSFTPMDEVGVQSYTALEYQKHNPDAARLLAAKIGRVLPGSTTSSSSSSSAESSEPCTTQGTYQVSEEEEEDSRF